MKTATDLHRSGTRVTESGAYICEAGETKLFNQGEAFPNCPKTGKETTWRHAEHQHRTGDRVTEVGRYTDADGQQVNLQIGDTFPNCPKSGKETTWKHQ